ncbi:MAG TPA: hypothetical protein PKE20_11195, partial [Promineifilum sp.]|nr:hypothetical protein [Promineifilum sp.]
RLLWGLAGYATPCPMLSLLQLLSRPSRRVATRPADDRASRACREKGGPGATGVGTGTIHRGLCEGDALRRPTHQVVKAL